MHGLVAHRNGPHGLQASQRAGNIGARWRQAHR